jgi:hypothetical protein
VTRIEPCLKVGPDGVLRLDVPMGASEANREVRVVVEEAPPTRPAMTQQTWAEWVHQMAGSITDPGFERSDQGQYEDREPL